MPRDEEEGTSLAEAGVSLEEALELASPAVSALDAIAGDDDDELDFDDDDGFLEDEDDGPIRTGDRRRRERPARTPSAVIHMDPDLHDLNNPDIVNLGESPMLGSHGGSEMFGQRADTFGRASSPKLYASAGQHPNCVQHRVWRMENGIPVGLGPIDAEATEEDFVRTFYSAMPKPGEGKFQFRCRPIDQRGNELGKEFIVNISEHNVALRAMRDAERRRLMEQQGFGGMGMGMGGWGGGHGRGGQQGGDVIVQGGDGSAGMAEEMGRMFETAVAAAEDQTKHLQATLEMERGRLRDEEMARAEERVNLATRASDTTEKMMERLMVSDRGRSEEAMKSQKQHSDLLMTTLTTVFQQQQGAARDQSERMREQDAARMQHDREYFERQRSEAEDRRRSDREEFERKRQLELEQMRIESSRKEKELESRREVEKEEARLRLERDKLEMEARREELRQERERARNESEERRAREKLDFERKMQIERDERERKERADRERWERERAEDDRKRENERAEAERKRDEERRDWERRDQQRRDESSREGDRRKEEMALQMKQMETNAQRDREHAERMAESARLERESQREAADRREKQEREAREFQEKERERRANMQLEEMRLTKERDREHQERMLQMNKIQNSGGLSGLTDMLGMETPELLGRIFGGGEDEGSWTDAIPKMLGGLGELGKVLAKGGPAGPPVQHGRTPREVEQRVPIQTPQGVKMITVDQLRELQAHQAAMQEEGEVVPLPNQSFVPEGEAGEAQAQVIDIPIEEPAIEGSDDYKAALEVDTTARAKAEGMTLKEMRNARRALRKLAQKVGKTEEAEWEGLLTSAIMAEPAIFTYIGAVSVYAAFAESRAEPELIERVIAAIKASGMVPDGVVPFNEADIVRLQAEADASEPVELPEEVPADVTQGVAGVHGKAIPREVTEESE
jgi:hypothetical protein